MDKFLIFLHFALSLTALPLLMRKAYRREMVAFAVVLSLSAAPAAMVLGPLAAAAGWVAVELFCRITGERRK